MPIGKNKILVLLLFPFLFFSCSKFDKIQRSDDMNAKLEAAYAYYDKKDYHKASVLFEGMVPLLRGRTEAEKAEFYQANSHYYQKQYIMSSYYFRDFIETYPRSEYAEEARFLYTKSLFKDSPRANLDQTNSSTALKAIQSFVNKYPESKYMDEINAMAEELNTKLENKAYENAKIYYNLGSYSTINYKAAVIAFDSFLGRYPDSKYSEELTFLKIDAQYQLAKSSVIKMQQARYYDAIEFYQNFVDKYPDSNLRKSAESIYESCLNKVEKEAKEEVN